jgi:putative transcriptional regulator
MKDTTAGKKKPAGTVLGQEIIADLTELAEALERGESPAERFTVRTVELPDEPGAYDATRVKATRDRLRASQAVFARLLGVSLQLVQSWEMGRRRPAAVARRLMDDMNQNPARWLALIRGGTTRGRRSTPPPYSAAEVRKAFALVTQVATDQNAVGLVRQLKQFRERTSRQLVRPMAKDRAREQ